MRRSALLFYSGYERRPLQPPARACHILRMASSPRERTRRVHREHLLHRLAATSVIEGSCGLLATPSERVTGREIRLFVRGCARRPREEAHASLKIDGVADARCVRTRTMKCYGSSGVTTMMRLRNFKTTARAGSVAECAIDPKAALPEKSREREYAAVTEESYGASEAPPDHPPPTATARAGRPYSIAAAALRAGWR